jgi:hypothetical protein
MRGGALPPSLLAAALGFALGFAPRRIALPGLAVFAGLGGACSLMRVPAHWTDPIFYLCWASVIVTALAVHLPKGVGVKTALVLSINAGLWAGAVIAVAGTPVDVAKALPWALICLPAGWLAAHRLQIAIKVVASWLVAVAVLAATLPTTTPTPGYMGDHLE